MLLLLEPEEAYPEEEEEGPTAAWRKLGLVEAAASPAGTGVGRMRRRFLSDPVETSEAEETVAGMGALPLLLLPPPSSEEDDDDKEEEGVRPSSACCCCACCGCGCDSLGGAGRFFRRGTWTVTAAAAEAVVAVTEAPVPNPVVCWKRCDCTGN